MPRWNTPKLTQAAVIVILIAATGAALTWLAQAPAPGRGARGPEPPAPPAPPPPIDTPASRPPRRRRPGTPRTPSRRTLASSTPSRRDLRRRREPHPGA